MPCATRLARSEPAPRRDPEHDQRVLQNLDVPPRGLIPQTGLFAEGLHVENAARRCGHQVEEPGEATEVSHQRLGLDFLAQIGVGVTPKVGGAQDVISLRVDAGKGAMRQRAVQVEVVPQLAGEQWVHVMNVNPPGQEVRLAAAELAGTRPGE